MKHKYRSKMTHLLSVAALSLSLFFTPAAIAHPLTALAAAAAGRAANTVAADTGAAEAAIPQANPYEDPSQCTFRAWELAAQAGHKLPGFGDAYSWKQEAIDRGYTVSDTLDARAVNSVAVWDSGVGGASWAGHVGWVVAVDGDRFLVHDRNWAPAVDTERWVTWEPGISFIVFDSPAHKAQAPAAPASHGKGQPQGGAGANSIAGTLPAGAGARSLQLVPQPLTLERLAAGSGRGASWVALPEAGGFPQPGQVFGPALWHSIPMPGIILGGPFIKGNALLAFVPADAAPAGQGATG